MEHSQYSVNICEDQQDVHHFRVRYDNKGLVLKETESPGRIVIWSQKKGEAEKLTCSCELYLTEGIICRHMFSVAKILQIKDLSNQIHQRWVLTKDNKVQKFHEFNQDWKKSIEIAEKYRAGKE